ncbi:anaphase-promoting complex subunit 5 isoform X2 [Canna indica]|uniref:Anaphase-promoting complex subunit 5 n=1 Tax=Canna indica TaxID=4628 RepID=A0AAQ3KUQ9_9LILI|nr:anaphase-promoting complex subunit 5 isoform X2 [Canna indica]
MEDEQIYLDPNSHLGVFLRSCILAFNMLSFEGVCHLLTNLVAYYNSNDSTYEMAEDDDFNESDYHGLLDDPELDCESSDLEEYGLENDPQAAEIMLHMQKNALPKFLEDNEASIDSKIKLDDDGAQSDSLAPLLNNFRSDDGLGILRSRWQVEGYLNAQAELLEKDAVSFPLNSFTATLKQLQKIAPEFHRVKYLQYLNALYHDDYIAALDNLHCYFDYSAGMEGLFSRSTSPSEFEVGRYETALLCLGTLHSHFGHPKKALEALTEAVRVSQQNNDDACLAYTLAAICKLLSEVGVSNMTGIIGSPYSLGTTTGLGTPLSTQQQLLVLLKKSLRRADHLKLTNLLAFNRLALAKFDLKHVKKPLLCFGPEASMKLRTCPISVCKELRLSSRVLSEFGADELLQLNDTGAFSTSWLKNLSTGANPWSTKLQKSRSLSVNDYDTFHFHAQPSPIPGSVLQLAGESYLLRATSWEHYGSAPLVRMNALVYATCFADAASSLELSSAYVKLIQHLSVFKGYTEAFKALKLAEEKFFSVSHSRIQLLKLQLLHERALHRGNLKVAQQVCDQFGVLSSSVNGVDMELKTEASLRHARTLLAANQYSQAAAVASNLFCTCYKFNMQVENATVLLLLAEIHKKSGDAVLGLPYALASLSFCKTFNLDLLEASASVTLAELWFSLGSSHAKKASYLIHQALPMILGHGGLELRARANIALAKCLLSHPSFSVSEDPDSVLDPLTQASEELEILEYHEMAIEAFYLMAIVYDTLGRLDEREIAASSFREHSMALENPQDEENLPTHWV